MTCPPKTCQSLLAQTDAQDWRVLAQDADDIVADAAIFFGRARAGADDNVGGLEIGKFLDINFVVAPDRRISRSE